MGMFKRRDKKESSAPAPEHAVIVHYSLSGEELGSVQEREAIFALEDRLIRAIEAADAGEFDGNEFGGGEAVLYAYGPDADALFRAMEQDLRAFPARPAHALLRFGGPADPGGIQRRIDL
jgi:hypothetical protein